MTLLLLYVLLAVGVSFLCSLLEAALLSARPYELQAREEAGSRAAKTLRRIVEHRLDDAIAAILTLNTFAHTVGAGLAGAQAEEVFGSAYLGLFVVVLTVLILVFSEILPKTIGAIYGGRMVPAVAVTVGLLLWLFKPALGATKALTGLLAHGGPRRITRQDVRAMITLAEKQGGLGPTEVRMLRNLLEFGRVRVSDAMTPRPVVRMLQADEPAERLLEDEDLRPFSRIVIYGSGRDDVIGYVRKVRVFEEILRGARREEPVGRWRESMPMVPESLPLAKVLIRLTKERKQLHGVLDEYGGFAGIVTLEDVIETALGLEFADETDEEPDLRASARKRRGSILRRRGRRRGREA